MLISVSELIGHLHPALVHLPIGILLAALLIEFLARREKYNSLRPALAITLLTGAIAAMLSSITGYVLSTTDDYDKTLVTWHMWMGFATTLCAFMLYAKEKNPQFPVGRRWLSVALLVLIFVTGHLGGSLTHGSDYFTKPVTSLFSNDTFSTMIKPIPNVEEAYVYSDVVKPILATKCYGCHGPNKQKGGLRMDDSLRLMKGGKDGVVIEPGKADKSDIIRRMLLPPDDDDHMPPKEKSQPSKDQVALIHWWIDNGAPLVKKVKEVPQPDKIRPVLLALQKLPEVHHAPEDVPSAPVEEADRGVLEKLKDMGVVVLPVAQNTNYVYANFVTDSIVSPEALNLLLQLKKQLVWLNLANTDAGDSTVEAIAQLDSLTRLHLEHTHLTDKGVARLSALRNLRYLNLVGTKVTASGVMTLKKLPRLRQMFLYGTEVRAEDFAAIRGAFSKTYVDSGGYMVPTLATDTTEVKAKVAY